MVMRWSVKLLLKTPPVDEINTTPQFGIFYQTIGTSSVFLFWDKLFVKVFPGAITNFRHIASPRLIT